MKFQKPFILVAAASLSVTLASCNKPAAETVTPSPTPEPTVMPTATPAPTVAPTPTPVLATPTPTPVPVAVVTPSPAATIVPATPGPVSDAGALAEALDKTTLVDRPADLTGLKVDSLVGDRAFYVTLGTPAKRMLVILDKKLNDGAADALLKIFPGQTLTIKGVIEKLPLAPEVAERFGVRGSETEGLKGDAIYLHANQVTITQQPAAR